MKRACCFLLMMVLFASIPVASGAEEIQGENPELPTWLSHASDRASDDLTSGLQSIFDPEDAQPVDPLAQAEAARRGLEAIQTTRFPETLVLPKEESYLTQWKTGYARKAFKAPCLRVERISRLHTGRLTMPYLYEGVRATVVAEENDMSCILYRGNDNELYAGWIQSIRLLDEFPGLSYTIGEKRNVEPAVRDDITVSWSRRSFLDSQQNYSVLSEPIEDCLGFTLEYQIIGENTPNWDGILGPRKIYVRSGDEWFEVGEFPYEDFGAVRVQVFLPEAMTIDAVGTIAQCLQPNIFYFRQTVYDILE